MFNIQQLLLIKIAFNDRSKASRERPPLNL
jgi:hypothetical protein